MVSITRDRNGGSRSRTMALLWCYWGCLLALEWCWLWLGLRTALDPVDVSWMPWLREGRLYVWAGAGLTVLIPAAYWFRNQSYKSHWREGSVTPDGYANGMLAVLTALAVVAAISSVGIVLTQQPWPGLVPLVLANVLHALNFPTGAPMHPQPPRLGEPAE